MAIKTPLSRPNKVLKKLPKLSRLKIVGRGPLRFFSRHWVEAKAMAREDGVFILTRKCFGGSVSENSFWKRFGLSLNSLHTLLELSEGNYTTEMHFSLKAAKKLTYSITFCKSVKYWKTSLGRRQTKTITELLDFRSKSRKSRSQNLQRGPPKSRLLSVPKHA